MERLEMAALSKIADLLSDSVKSLIIPEIDVWKKIFYNAEQSEIYDNKEPQFSTKIVKYGYRPDEKELYHNEKTYNALIETFKELEYRREELIKLLDCMAKKMSLYRIFPTEVEKELKSEYSEIKGQYFEDFFWKIDSQKRYKILVKNSTKEFKEFRRNLNIIGLDIAYIDDELTVLPFDNRAIESAADLNVINQWLKSKYSNISESYEAARKAYGNGDEVGCITHCRNIITGIFSYKKEEGTEWYKGLQKVCKADKNITEITNAKSIPSIKYNPHGSDNEKYQYPRFNLINKLYVFTCDLGAHTNEGNINNGEIDSEITTIEDALLALRITEDVLVWLYQTGSMNN